MIPSHLTETHQLLKRAYPDGLPEHDYLPLVYIMSERLCEENLAKIISLTFGQDEGIALNDVFKAKSSVLWTVQDLERVRHLLEVAGYSDWVAKE